MKNHDISITVVGVFLGIALAGCSGAGKDVVVHNTGTLCVYPAGETNENPSPSDSTPRQYLADEPANLVVVFDSCLSSSCTTNRQASCTATQSGNAFSVDATASYHETGDSTCSTDCRRLIARCATPPLAAGDVTFSYVGISAPLSIPSTVAPPCVFEPR